jgi:hypothetical protein
MEVQTQFENALQSFPHNIKEIAFQTRKLIYHALPELTEVVWEKQRTAGYGTGPKKNSEHFCWIMPTKNHVNLGFNYGVDLPDPKGVLEGTGKSFRHFKVKSIEDLKNKDLIAILNYSTTFKVPPIKK